MTNEQVTAKHAKLCSDIRRHDRLYYVDAQPTITDKEYDELFQELLDYESKHTALDIADSPTQRVGGEPVDSLNSITHGEYMLSIDNAFNSEELRKRWDKWHKELGTTPQVMLEAKVDGLAVSLLYSNGVLTSAVTRGDGSKGDDILHSARNMRGVPMKLEKTGAPDFFKDTFVEVRGEAFISQDDFRRLTAAQTKAGEKPWTHPRSAAVGALRSLDPKQAWARHVRFIMHGIGTCSAKLLADNWNSTKHQFKLYGMPVILTLAHGALQFDDISPTVDAARRTIAASELPTDGVVVKLSKFADQNALGSSSRAINWAIAVKKDLYTGITTVANLAIQVGKLGTLTPVVLLNPVDIDGTSITKATLHNFDEVDRLDIRMGDTVLVEKAGKIIPHIISVDKSKRVGSPKPFQRPTTCPLCKGVAAQDGVAIKCTNTLGCNAQLAATILAAADRDRLCIDGLGPSLVQNMISNGLVKNFVDLWYLGNKRKELIELDRLGEKSVNKLLAELEAAKKLPPDRLLSCLNIPGLGRTKSKLLVNTYGKLEEIASLSVEELKPLVGNVASKSIAAWFEKKENVVLIGKLLALGFNPGEEETQPASADGPLVGKKCCATGSFEKYTRETIHNAIVTAGGTVASSVSSKTAYLIVGKDGGSKVTNAAKLKVPCLTEAQFDALIKV